jgi:hypothetical protein
MTTATDPSAERAILNWAADRIDAGPHDPVLDTDPLQEAYDDARRHYAGELRRWATELDATPTAWELPPEPGPEVTELWDRHGCHWRRDVPGHWLLVEHADAGEGLFWHLVIPCVSPWRALLAEHGPLSAVPPEQPEVPDAAG